jgi:hypothetical protein
MVVDAAEELLKETLPGAFNPTELAFISALEVFR